MNIPSDLKYTKDHEWVKIDGDVATVGVTDYAQGELGDVVYIDLPEIGDAVEKDDSFGTIEAVKAVADLFSPVSGDIEARNKTLQDEPETINKDPYGEGWMVKIKMSDSAQLSELMNAAEYEKLVV